MRVIGSGRWQRGTSLYVRVAEADVSSRGAYHFIVLFLRYHPFTIRESGHEGEVCGPFHCRRFGDEERASWRDGIMALGYRSRRFYAHHAFSPNGITQEHIVRVFPRCGRR